MRRSGARGREVAEGSLFDRIAAGDDVEQQPAAGQPLEGGGLMGGPGRVGRPGRKATMNLSFVVC